MGEVFAVKSNFNPPTSCEVGQYHEETARFTIDFNPPTSCEVGHDLRTIENMFCTISIHPPPARWDAQICTV